VGERSVPKTIFFGTPVKKPLRSSWRVGCLYSPSCQEGFSEIQLDLDLNQMPPYAILSDVEKGRKFGGVSEHRRAEHAADADAG
jgi:hypothetical protein